MANFVLLWVLACSTISLVATSNPEDAVVRSLREVERITAGYPAIPNQFPHQVHVETVDRNGDRSNCGGSLISTTWVLTAAQCLIDQVLVYVRVGSINIETSQLKIESRNFTYHEQYDTNTYFNDIGVIYLGREVPLSNSMKPILLPTRAMTSESFTGRVSTASGWGYTENNGPYETKLYFANMNVVSNQYCGEIYGKDVIRDSTVCTTGNAGLGQSSICTGDTGGALVMRDDNAVYIQIGIGSFYSGKGCDSRNPSGYARVSKFIDWIAAKTGIPVRN